MREKFNSVFAFHFNVFIIGMLLRMSCLYELKQGHSFSKSGMVDVILLFAESAQRVKLNSSDETIVWQSDDPIEILIPIETIFYLSYFTFASK